MTVAKYIDPDGNIIPFGLGQQGRVGAKGDKGDKGEPGGWVTSSVVPEGTSLNSIVTPGLYWVPSSVASAVGSSAPVSIGGWLEVIYNASFGVMQRYAVASSTSTTYHTRQRFGASNWGSWRELITPGSIGSGDLTGVGMPNGVVSAPPGVYYTDTAGTNGAWRWLKKTGTGNTGWEPVVADTGARNVADTLVNGWTASHLYLQRIGNIVYLTSPYRSSTSLKANDAVTGRFLPIPSGFTPWVPVYSSISQMRASDPTPRFINLTRHESNHLALETGASIVTGTVSYITQDPWPTVLPGTAA